jgi:LMBR1 domain-containing protein 1
MIIASSIYLLVYFQSPEDKNQAYLPKVVVILGLCLSSATVLLLPLDVANNTTGGLHLDGLWQAVIMAIAVMCIIVIPFCIFYYEEQDPEITSVKKQFKGAIFMTIMFFIVAVLLIAILYAFFNETQIPYQRYSAKIQTTSTALCVPGGTGGCSGTEKLLKIKVTIVVCIIALLAFCGWFLLTLFGGIGMTALPMDMLNAYRKRPRKMEPSDRAHMKLELQHRASTLISRGKELNDEKKHGASGRKYRKTYLQYRQSVYFLERDFEQLRLLVKEGGGSVFKWAFILFLGCLAVVISLLWIIHIVLYMVFQPPVSPFLNTMFVELDNFFSLFGTVMYGLFAFYLLWAVMKGNIKFGLRFLCIAIHPMKIGDTLMNSFLFNVGLILFACVAVTQFCVQAFSQYARLTAASSLFGVFIKYMIYLRYVWTYYLYAFLGLSALTFVYLMFFPKDRKQEDIDVELIALQGAQKRRKL